MCVSIQHIRRVTTLLLLHSFIRFSCTPLFIPLYTPLFISAVYSSFVTDSRATADWNPFNVHYYQLFTLVHLLHISIASICSGVHFVLVHSPLLFFLLYTVCIQSLHKLHECAVVIVSEC